ncbi:Hypothetical_protein [Hexamita inflata]|uniref:Hypothetical_protein n=1 Tax=Hexamita inflata TaxID=28002 RepID=A0AA86ND64_9EUKA|nr:Hypothetical protein HINF_LOCUS4828 [Hexamita inflata]
MKFVIHIDSKIPFYFTATTSELMTADEKTYEFDEIYLNRQMLVKQIRYNSSVLYYTNYISLSQQQQLLYQLSDGNNLPIELDGNALSTLPSPLQNQLILINQSPVFLATKIEKLLYAAGSFSALYNLLISLKQNEQISNIPANLPQVVIISLRVTEQSLDQVHKTLELFNSLRKITSVQAQSELDLDLLNLEMSPIKTTNNKLLAQLQKYPQKIKSLEDMIKQDNSLKIENLPPIPPKPDTVDTSMQASYRNTEESVQVSQNDGSLQFNSNMSQLHESQTQTRKKNQSQQVSREYNSATSLLTNDQNVDSKNQSTQSHRKHSDSVRSSKGDTLNLPNPSSTYNQSSYMFSQQESDLSQLSKLTGTSSYAQTYKSEHKRTEPEKDAIKRQNSQESQGLQRENSRNLKSPLQNESTHDKSEKVVNRSNMSNASANKEKSAMSRESGTDCRDVKTDNRNEIPIEMTKLAMSKPNIPKEPRKDTSYNNLQQKINQANEVFRSKQAQDVDSLFNSINSTLNSDQPSIHDHSINHQSLTEHSLNEDHDHYEEQTTPQHMKKRTARLNNVMQSPMNLELELNGKEKTIEIKQKQTPFQVDELHDRIDQLQFYVHGLNNKIQNMSASQVMHQVDMTKSQVNTFEVKATKNIKFLQSVQISLQKHKCVYEKPQELIQCDVNPIFRPINHVLCKDFTDITNQLDIKYLNLNKTGQVNSQVITEQAANYNLPNNAVNTSVKNDDVRPSDQFVRSNKAQQPQQYYQYSYGRWNCFFLFTM